MGVAQGRMGIVNHLTTKQREAAQMCARMNAVCLFDFFN
jgi:hypothetical protein